MALTHTQTSIIGASLASAAVIIILLLLFFLRGHVPFTVSNSHPHSTNPPFSTTTTTNSPTTHITTSSFRRRPLARHQADEASILGSYEKYAELYVPPNKQPRVVALDIMMRSLLATGLPGRAKMRSPPHSQPASDAFLAEAAAMENGERDGERAPRVILKLKRPGSFTPSEHAGILLSPLGKAGKLMGACGVLWGR